MLKDSVINFAWFFVPFLAFSPTIQGDDCKTRAAASSEICLWPDATVEYGYEDPINNTNMKTIEDAANEIMMNTCIKLKRSDLAAISNKSHVVIQTRELRGCQADFVGMKSGEKQYLTNSGCPYSHLLAEWMHILGFYHEYQRPDRDLYVILNTSNIVEKDILSDDYYKGWKRVPFKNWINFGVCFDFSSVLTHNSNVGAIDDKYRTIIPINKNVTFGRKGNLTKMDIYKINKLYKCPSKNF